MSCRSGGREANRPTFARPEHFAIWTPCRHKLDRKSGSAAVFCVINTHCFASATKAAVTRLIGTDGAEEVNLAKSRPQHIREVELAVHALPKQEA
jgi:hypothetical protein